MAAHKALKKAAMFEEEKKLEDVEKARKRNKNTTFEKREKNQMDI